MHQGSGFLAKTLGKAYFVFKLIGRAMVAKAPLVSQFVLDGLNFSIYTENLKELCHKFYQNSNSRNYHQIE